MPTVLITQILFVALGATTGLIFNGYILCILLWQKRLQTVNHILLLHLACVDLLFSGVLLFGNTFLGLFGPGEFINTTTTIITTVSSDLTTPLRLVNQCQGFLWTLFPIILIWTVCGLCCDRYLAVSSPLRYLTLVTRKRSVVFIIVIWFLSVGLCTPPLFGICNYSYSVPRSSNYLSCEDVLNQNDPYTLIYTLIYILWSILLPIFCILGCNLHMLLIARHHHHRIISAIYEITLRAQATVTHQKNPQYLSKVNGRYAIFTISQFITIACTLPLYVIFTLESFTRLNLNPVLVSFLTLLLSFTPSINGYVYGVKSKVLKQTFKRLLQRYLYKKQASLEIDRRLSLRSQSSIRAFNGLQSFLSTTSLVQTSLKSYPRRNSAPIVFSFTPTTTRIDSLPNCSSEKTARRQSICAIEETKHYHHLRNFQQQQQKPPPLSTMPTEPQRFSSQSSEEEQKKKQQQQQQPSHHKPVPQLKHPYPNQFNISRPKYSVGLPVSSLRTKEKDIGPKLSPIHEST